MSRSGDRVEPASFRLPAERPFTLGQADPLGSPLPSKKASWVIKTLLSLARPKALPTREPFSQKGAFYVIGTNTSPQAKKKGTTTMSSLLIPILELTIAFFAL